MKFPTTYPFLKQQKFIEGEYSIVPIRYEDRLNIMQWRNEQIYHLRQATPLTEINQENYFKNVVAKLFEQEQPNQILFSYLKNGECIGYGGLVHINWIDKNAEISFIMNTELEKNEFHFHWKTYLNLLEKVAFKELKLHKIFTYAFDVRPHLYEAVESAGFIKDAVLKEHCYFNGKFKDVIIHSKINRKIVLRKATINDTLLYFDWANDILVRKNAINEEHILLENHKKWFQKKITERTSYLLVLEINNVPVGQIRFDKNEQNYFEIDYSIAKEFRGNKFGNILVKKGIEKVTNFEKKATFLAKVKQQNIASKRVFLHQNFKEIEIEVIKNKTYSVYILAINE